MIRYSPFDIRFILRLVLMVTAWKFLSTDYSAIAQMTDTKIFPISPRIIDRAVDFWKTHLMTTPEHIRAIQMITAAILVLAAWRPYRCLMILALVGLLGVEWSAQQYRIALFEMDATVFVLLITVCWPASLKWVRDGDAAVTGPATRLGWLYAAYVASAYLMAGISKPLFSITWFDKVHLEDGYAAVQVLYNSRLAGFFDDTATFFEILAHRYTWISPVLAVTTFFAEVLWWASIVSRRCRMIIPITMLAMHIGILLTVGIFFFPFPYVAFSVIVPWRMLVRRKMSAPADAPQIPLYPTPEQIDHADRPAEELPYFFREKLWLPSAAGLLLAVLPAVFSFHTFPIADYCNFGWSYAPYAKPFTVYRLGYLDPDDNTLKPLPVNHGGFFDYLLMKNAEDNIRFYLNGQTHEIRDVYIKRVALLGRCIRPYKSNKWLLGDFSCPGHTFHHADPVPLDKFNDLQILKGEYHYELYRGEAHWESLGSVSEHLRKVEHEAVAKKP
jgi:hypothetical protein